MENLKSNSDILKNINPRNFSIIAGCDSFLKFLNDSHHDVTNLDVFKERVTQMSGNFMLNASGYRQKIADIGSQLIKDDMVSE